MTGTVVGGLVVMPSHPGAFLVYRAAGTSQNPRAGEFMAELVQTDAGWKVARCAGSVEGFEHQSVRVVLLAIEAFGIPSTIAGITV